MAYNITIEEIQNGITVATVNDLGINVTVEEVVNGITITPPVVNQLSVTNIEYPVTVSYNGIIVQDGGGIAANGLPAGGSIGQFLKKTGVIDYDVAWANISDLNTTYSLSAETATGGANLRLTGSDTSTDDVKLAAGSNVTIARTDANTITISSASSFTELVQDTTPQLGGNLDVNGNKITSAGNADVNIKASGTGEINLESIVNVGDGTGPGFIFARGSQSLLLLSDPLNNAGQAALRLDVNGDVEFGPGPGGRVLNDAEIIVFGTGESTAQLTSSGSRSIELSTNQGLNSGKITVAAGANGNIVLEPNGSGDIQLNADTVRIGDVDTTAILTSNGTGNLRVTAGAGMTMWRSQNRTTINGTHPGTLDLAEMNVNGIDYGFEFTTTRGFWVAAGSTTNFLIDGAPNGAVSLQSNGTGAVVITGGSSANTGSNLTLNSGTGGALLRGANGSGGQISVGGSANSHIEITPDGTGDVRLNADTVRLGDAGVAALITTNNGSLTLNTNSGASSGSIQIALGANGNISITPNGTGNVVLDGLNWPQADGSANYVLKTNGSGQLAWASVNSLGLSTGINDIVEDTTPQLGGNLDVNGYNITTTQTNADVKIAANGTGKVKLSNIAYPNTDGSAGQVLKTNGSGSLDWADKQDPTLVNDSQPNIQSTGQHWYRPVTGAFYTARNGGWEPVNDDGFF